MSQPASPSSNKKNLVCKVFMLDDTEETFYVPNKSKGCVLFEMVVRKLQLLEADYFDLQYLNIEGILCWLDHEKTITSHLPPSSLTFEFVVKFYTPDPGMLEEEYTRYLFALQVKRDLLTGGMPCHDQTAALLLSYIVQADYGDLTEEDLELNPDYLRSINHFNTISPELETSIICHHKEHIGQTPTEADYNLLDTARKVDFYGISLQAAKDHEGVPLHLAGTHMGVVVFQCNTRINTFSWAKIRKLSFKRKKFLIKLHPEGYGFYKDTVEFYFSSRNECKNFWKRCLEHHAFFRCHSVKKIPRNKTRVVSHGSSFRYSGRTQKQLVDFVRENFVKRPNFHRSTSMRTVNGVSRTGTLKSKAGTQDTPGHMSRSRKSDPLMPGQRGENRQSLVASAVVEKADKEKDGTEWKGKGEGFVSGILRPGKSELTLKRRKYSIKTGTVDDFDCSYFKTFHATRYAGHSLKTRHDAFKDNASQDSYRLQESRDSLTTDLKDTCSGDDELKGATQVPGDGFTSGEDFVDGVEEEEEEEERLLMKGKSMAELGRNASLRSCRSMHHSKRQQFAKMRSATMAYDNVIVNLKDCFDGRLPGQSYSTDIDSVLSPLEDKAAFKESKEATASHTSGVDASKMDASTESQGEGLLQEEEECITIIDSKEDGIQYYLHKRPSKQTDRSLLPCHLKAPADSTKDMLEEVKVKISKTDRKLYDYISCKQLPHRDTFSSRDDTLDNDVFVKNDDLGVWRKVEKKDEVKPPAVLKNKSAKELSTRGRILSESDSDHFNHRNKAPPSTHNTKDTRYNFKTSKQQQPKKASLPYELEDELNLSECDDEEDKKSCFSSFDNEISEQQQQPRASFLFTTVCSENLNQIVYKRRVSVLPYNELVKLDLAFHSEMEYYGRHYFCTIDHDVFCKAESSSDNDRFSWMAKNRFRHSVKSSISYRTGYATGSSSSLSVNEELDSACRPDLKGRRVLHMHQATRMPSCHTTTAHIDKHGHVMEWLEEQALLEPSHKGSHLRGDLRHSARMAALKHAESLPGKGTQASVHSSASSRHPGMHNQSSFSTQSFPEPVMEISSDECALPVKPNADGFYDVNRILDYVADSNRYINPQLLGFRTSESQPTQEYCHNTLDAASGTPTEAQREKKLTRLSTFDAGRYRLSNKAGKSFSHSIDPEKMFSSELRRAVQQQRSSLSSQNNEEDHVSDILDALGGHVDTPSLRQCESFKGLLGATQDLSRRLQGLDVGGGGEKVVSTETACYQDMACLEKAESELAIEQCSEVVVERVNRERLLMELHRNLLQQKDTVEAGVHVTENLNVERVQAAVSPISLAEYHIERCSLPEKHSMKRLMVACEAMNRQVEEKSGPVLVSEEAIPEVRRVEVAQAVVRKARSKPRRVPDKFELFLAGVRVNLVNILERDASCENLKEHVTRAKRKVPAEVFSDLIACENMKLLVVKKREFSEVTYLS